MKKLLFILLACSLYAIGYTQESKGRVEYFSVKENLSKEVVFNWRVSGEARNYEYAEIYFSPDGHYWVELITFWTNSITRWKYKPTLKGRVNNMRYQIFFKSKKMVPLSSPIRKITIYGKNPIPKKDMKTYSSEGDIEQQLRTNGIIWIKPTPTKPKTKTI